MSAGDVEMAEAPAVAEEWVDVSEAQDGGIMKKVLVEGSGPKAKAGGEVTVYYHGKLESDGSTFDSNLEGPGFKFDLGVGRVIKGWDQGVATMCKGEKATLKIREDYGYGKNGSPPKIPGGATLLFDVELLSFTTGKDITEKKDGGVVQTDMLDNGVNDYKTPKEDGTVKAHVAVRVGDEEVFSTRAGEPLSWVVDDDPLADGVTRGLDLAVTKLTKGARSIFEVRSDYAYGEAGYDGTKGPKVGPGTNLVYDVEVVEFENQPESWTLQGVDEKLAAALARKEAANGKFSQKRFAKAQRMYKAAQMYVSHGEWGEKEKEVQQLKTTLHVNKVACMMAQPGFDQKEARKEIKEALDISPSHVKALFRSAKLYTIAGAYPEAIAELQKALDEDAENASLKKELARVRALQKKQDQKDKAMYARMFK